MPIEHEAHQTGYHAYLPHPRPPIAAHTAIRSCINTSDIVVILEIALGHRTSLLLPDRCKCTCKKNRDSANIIQRTYMKYMKQIVTDTNIIRNLPQTTERIPNSIFASSFYTFPLRRITNSKPISPSCNSPYGPHQPRPKEASQSMWALRWGTIINQGYKV